MFGLLNLNKPTGVTSRRVVDQVQRLVRPAKVGHAGTLDPLACGVLVVGIGQATRLVEYVQEMPKQYRATFLLGKSSTTEDTDGQITELAGAVAPPYERLKQIADELIGDIQQRPPAFSALKVAGRRAYDLARAGQHVELAARTVQIHSLQIVRYDYPELCLDVTCGSGTYVRSLGRDLAERTGTAAVMSALERRAIGHFTLVDAVDPDGLARDNLADHLLSPTLAVRGLMDQWVVSEDQRKRIAHGLPIEGPRVEGDRCAALDAGGRLVAILIRRAGDQWRAVKNFPSDA
ncbi:MAG: tRNA pseudouridine(55) synthase TruB [Pirellulales bacterium]